MKNWTKRDLIMWEQIKVGDKVRDKRGNRFQITENEEGDVVLVSPTGMKVRYLTESLGDIIIQEGLSLDPAYFQPKVLRIES